MSVNHKCQKKLNSTFSMTLNKKNKNYLKLELQL